MREAAAFGEQGVCGGWFLFECFSEGFRDCGERLVEEEVDPRAEGIEFGYAGPQQGLDTRNTRVRVGFREVVVGRVSGFLVKKMEGKKFLDFGEGIFSVEAEEVLFRNASCHFKLPPSFDLWWGLAYGIEGSGEGLHRTESVE